MTRQQEITLAQVREKQNRAASDVKHHLSRALAFSQNEYLYEKHVAASRKAANDFTTWGKVLESLQVA